MNMPPVTPGYAHGKQQMMPGGGRGMIAAKEEPKVDLKKHQSGLTPKSVTPRTPAVRLGFDPHSSKKKRKLGPGERVCFVCYTYGIAEYLLLFDSPVPVLSDVGTDISILWRPSGATKDYSPRYLFLFVKRRPVQFHTCLQTVEQASHG
jgi:hypothetical protein